MPSKKAGSTDKPITVTPNQLRHAFRALVGTSPLLARSDLSARLGKQFGTARNLYTVLGYNKKPTFKDYWTRYMRDDIAATIVDAPANATWRTPPEICEDEDSTSETAFEKAWQEVAERLKVWHYFNRVDKLAGVGMYAVLLIGAKSRDTSFESPIEMGSLKRAEDLLYLATYSQEDAEIETFISNSQDPRFGRPEFYKIEIGGDLHGVKTQQLKVHHSRVIHVAENLLRDEIYGIPRQQRTLNRQDDLNKVVGGSAEMFWQGAYRGLVIKTQKDYESPFTADTAAVNTSTPMNDMMDEFVHGLRRWIHLEGLEADTLDGQDVRPKEAFDCIISLLSGTTGIPKRIFLGSERGELASSQDEANWNARVSERQENFAEPHILRAFVDRLIEWGALPAPKKKTYTIEWPSLFELDDKEKAQNFRNVAEGLKALSPTGAPDLLMPAESVQKLLVQIFGESWKEIIDVTIDTSALHDDPNMDPATATFAGQMIDRGKKQLRG